MEAFEILNGNAYLHNSKKFGGKPQLLFSTQN